MFNKKCNSKDICDTRLAQEKKAELMKTPLRGRYIVKVMAVNYKKAHVDEEGKNKPEYMHLFCRVVRRDGTYDPRPVNTVFSKWSNVDPDKFDALMGNLQAATNVDTPDDMKGKVFSTVLRVRQDKEVTVHGQYFFSWFQPAVAPERDPSIEDISYKGKKK